jgi:hypothetical protein
MHDTADESLEIKIRHGKPEDAAYIASSWLKGIFKGSYFAKRIPKETFNNLHRHVITHALSRSTVLVAHPEGDEDTIIGFLIYDSQHHTKPLVHWTYTRLAWRNVGIARQLFDVANLDPANCQFPTWSFDVDSLVKRFPGLENGYNPYLAFV